MKRKKIKKMMEEITLDDLLLASSDPLRELSYSSYKDLLSNRTILINGDIEENIIERVVVQLEKLSREHPKTPITILINSYGGSYYDGLAVVDAIRSTKTPVTTVALGKCMSAAFSIFLAGDLRVVNENSLLMAHGGSQTGIDQTLASAIDDAEVTRRLFERVSDYYASRTKIQKKEWFDLFTGGRDRYFFAEEAVKMEIAHEIYKAQVRKHSPKPPKKKVQSKKRKSKSTRKKKKRKR